MKGFFSMIIQHFGHFIFDSNEKIGFVLVEKLPNVE